MNWAIHHKATTQSTNTDALAGVHGDVFTADFQFKGRGRLDHTWMSENKRNLMMSVVLSVDGMEPSSVSTLPLVAGLAVAKGVEPFIVHAAPKLKWPNDILVNDSKLSGILCERHGDNVIVGIGVNVLQDRFPPELRATSLLVQADKTPTVNEVRDSILSELDRWYTRWKEGGFAAAYEEIRAIDYLKGRQLSVRQTDHDNEPTKGLSGGIMSDGSLDVGGTKIYAGEAHVERL